MFRALYCPAPSATIIAVDKDVRREVDMTLIEEMRRLSPQERLELHDRMLATALELRHAFRELQANKSAS